MSKIQEALALLNSLPPDERAAALAGMDLSVLADATGKAKDKAKEQEEENKAKIGKVVDKIKEMLGKVGFSGVLSLDMTDGTWKVSAHAVKRGPRGPREAHDPTDEERKAVKDLLEGKAKMAGIGEPRKGSGSYARFKVGDAEITATNLLKIGMENGIIKESDAVKAFPGLSVGQIRGVLFRNK